MNVMKDNEYDIQMTEDVIFYCQLRPWGVSIGNWGRRPLLLFSRWGGGGRGEEVAWHTLYAGSITSHCSANEPALQETGPTTAAEIEPAFYEKSGFLSVEIINFIPRCIFRNMHQPLASSPFRVVSEASRKTTRERATPPLPCSAVSFRVPCDFSFPLLCPCSQGLRSRSRERKGKLSAGIQEFSKYDLAPLLLDLIF